MAISNRAKQKAHASRCWDSIVTCSTLINMRGRNARPIAIPANATRRAARRAIRARVPAVRRGVYLAEANNRLRRRFIASHSRRSRCREPPGRMARASYALRLSGAALMGGDAELVGYAAQGLAARSRSSISSFICCRIGILIAAARAARHRPCAGGAAALPEPACRGAGMSWSLTWMTYLARRFSSQ